MVALGFDTAKGDPTGTWSLRARDFRSNGRMIGSLGLPVVVIQEGGYRTRTLGTNARSFFDGLAEACSGPERGKRAPRDPHQGVVLRREVTDLDVPRIRALVEITGFFRPDEIDIAAELVAERAAGGPGSGYRFVLAEQYGRLVGYICYGPVPCTVSSFDIYWIAVHPDFQGRGLGRRLLKDAERLISEEGGTRIYVDTSTKDQYASTRAFYEGCGYGTASVMDDFYAPGDGKVIYVKLLRAVRGSLGVGSGGEPDGADGSFTPTASVRFGPRVHPGSVRPPVRWRRATGFRPDPRWSRPHRENIR